MKISTWVNQIKKIKKTQEGILFLICLLDKFELITKEDIRNLEKTLKKILGLGSAEKKKISIDPVRKSRRQ